MAQDTLGTSQNIWEFAKDRIRRLFGGAPATSFGVTPTTPSFLGGLTDEDMRKFSNEVQALGEQTFPMGGVTLGQNLQDIFTRGSIRKPLPTVEDIFRNRLSRQAQQFTPEAAEQLERTQPSQYVRALSPEAAAQLPPPEPEQPPEEKGWLGTINEFLSSDGAKVLAKALAAFSDPTGKTLESIEAREKEDRERKEKESQIEAAAQMLLDQGAAETIEQAREMAKIPEVRSKLGTGLFADPLEQKKKALEVEKMQREAETQKKTERMQNFKRAQQFKLFSGQIGDALNMIKRGAASEGWGVLLSGIPATAARTLQGQLNAIKGSNFLQAIESLRTPNGLGIGPLSNQESAHLIASLGNLDMGQETAQLQKTLKVLHGYIERLYNFQRKLAEGTPLTDDDYSPGISLENKAHFSSLQQRKGSPYVNMTDENWEDYWSDMQSGKSAQGAKVEYSHEVDTEDEAKQYIARNPKAKVLIRSTGNIVAE